MWLYSSCRAFGTVGDRCIFASRLLVSPGFAIGTCNAGVWVQYSNVVSGLGDVWSMILKWYSCWAEDERRWNLFGTCMASGAEKLKLPIICRRQKIKGWQCAFWLHGSLQDLQHDDLGLGSLLLPSTQEQVTPGTRCSFSTLQEGLISKTGIDTIGFLPYGFMGSAQTQICSQADSVVYDCLD